MLHVDHHISTGKSHIVGEIRTRSWRSTRRQSDRRRRSARGPSRGRRSTYGRGWGRGWSDDSKCERLHWESAIPLSLLQVPLAVRTGGRGCLSLGRGLPEGYHPNPICDSHNSISVGSWLSLQCESKLPSSTLHPKEQDRRHTHHPHNPLIVLRQGWHPVRNTLHHILPPPPKRQFANWICEELDECEASKRGKEKDEEGAACDNESL